MLELLLVSFVTILSVLIQIAGLYSLTWMVLAAGCFISNRRSPSSCSLFTSLSWDRRLLFLKSYSKPESRKHSENTSSALLLKARSVKKHEPRASPRSDGERPADPPYGRSSPVGGSWLVRHSGSLPLYYRTACTRTGCSGSVGAILSCPAERRQNTHKWTNS